MRNEIGMGEDRMDICGIGEEKIRFDEQLSWYFWFVLAHLMPILHKEIQDHPEKYEESAPAHVLGANDQGGRERGRQGDLGLTVCQDRGVCGESEAQGGYVKDFLK